jgi:hypothetical protein
MTEFDEPGRRGINGGSNRQSVSGQHDPPVRHLRPVEPVPAAEAQEFSPEARERVWLQISGHIDDLAGRGILAKVKPGNESSFERNAFSRRSSPRR